MQGKEESALEKWRAKRMKKLKNREHSLFKVMRTLECICQAGYGVRF